MDGQWQTGLQREELENYGLTTQLQKNIAAARAKPSHPRPKPADENINKDAEKEKFHATRLDRGLTNGV
jgi:hypothetical protein